MNFVDTIHLSPFQILLAGALCGYIVLAGRAEWALGIYMATATWTRSIMFGPVVHTWVLLATMIAAGVVYGLRNPPIPVLPDRHRWVVPWMLLWWAWMLLLMAVFHPQPLMPLLRQLLLYVIPPASFALLVGRTPQRIAAFAVAYLVTTIVGGLVALGVVDISLRELLLDPALAAVSVVRLNIINYHWFASGFAVSLVLSLPLLYSARHVLTRIALLGAALFCVLFLVVAGSRQSILGAAIALAGFLLWSFSRGGAARLSAVAVAGAAAFLGTRLLLSAPEVLTRSRAGTVVEATSGAVAERLGLWAQGWQEFVASPVWGDGFGRHVVAHNIVLGTLSDQGVVGLAFLVAFAYFLARQLGGRRGAELRRRQAPIAVWRVGLVAVLLFRLVTAMFSAGVLSSWELYWAGAFLWWLKCSQEGEGGLLATRPAQSAPAGSELGPS